MSIIELILHFKQKKITKTKKNDEKEKPKLKNSVLKKTIILNVDGWTLNRRMKSMVSVCSIFGATSKAMKHHIMRCLEDQSPNAIL